jgi:nitrogen fixation/metabolism regulation signal transduction histidine kinase
VNYQRRIILINRRFQLKFAVFVCAWIILLALVFPWIVSSVSDTIIALVQRKVDAGALAAVQDLQNGVLLWLWITSVLVIAASFLWSIYLSHRIAGPVFRVQKALEAWSGGRTELKIQLRKKDNFVELSDAYNSAAQTHADLVAQVEAAKEQLTQLSTRLSGEERATLESVLGDLK